MRAPRRALVTTIVTLAVLSVGPSTAGANGGAYLEFDRSYYVAGDTGVATAYVSVPTNRRGLFERGPFYLFALPVDASIVEGRAIPSTAARLATFSIERERDVFELTARFTVPALAPHGYAMALCNDPCTIAGFREPLGGWISVVETRREAQLLVRTAELRSRLSGARSEVRRAERRLEAVRGELDAQLEFGASERARMTAEIERLEARLASARASDAKRSDVPWIAAVVVLAAIASAAAFLLRPVRPVTEGASQGEPVDAPVFTAPSSEADGSDPRAGASARAP
jgi:hypothetical protein